METDRMERMIKEEIGRIVEQEERVLFKELIEQVFLSLYQANQEMYQALERRIMDDLAVDRKPGEIRIGIGEREEVAQSHHFLFPLREEDINPQSNQADSLYIQLREKGRVWVKTLFLPWDYLEIKKLLEREGVEGSILTDQGELPAQFVLCPHGVYLEEIEKLYQVFIRNGRSWQTVNTAYLHKFVDVYLLPEGLALTGRENILDIKIYLEEKSSAKEEAAVPQKPVYENYIPLWNIKKLSLTSVGFPVPCEKKKAFEYLFSLRGQGEEHVYLIGEEEGIYRVRQQPSQLVVTSDFIKKGKWKIYRIQKGESRSLGYFSYPVMSNQRKDGFVERFTRNQGVRVGTAAELARFIRGFGLEEYVAYQGYQILDAVDRGESETYSMNEFILDEIRDGRSERCLLLTFQRREKLAFLQRDMISFLVSEVQLLYPEYRCEGKLEEPKEVESR